MTDGWNFQEAAEVMHRVAITAQMMMESLANALGLAFGDTMRQTIRGNLTPRQYHLYVHGKRRVSKKWENAAWKKARLRERRKNHV